MRVQVNLSDEMVEKVDKYAKQFGLSRSALCSVLVGQGIMGYEMSSDAINLLSDKLSETLKNAVINSKDIKEI